MRAVKPGDVIWIAGGTYRHSNRSVGAMGFEVRLAGAESQPIHVLARKGQRVTVDGGLNVLEPATHLWMSGLEIIVSENSTMPRRIEEPGSHPKSANRPWGGLNVYSGTNCKFINLIIHDNAQGVSWWSGSRESELHGCIIYDNGWEAPDRGHGHAIYTQNATGMKTISDCIMSGGHGYSVHAYGSSKADVDNYLLEGNVCYRAGTFLIGGGKPSRRIKVLNNFISDASMQLGYSAPFNEDCDVQDNVIVNGSLVIKNFREVVNERNLVLANADSRPPTNRIILRPNRYEPGRANIVVLNWEKKSHVTLELNGLLKQGDAFRVLDPRDFFGKPVLQGRYDVAVSLPMSAEFGVFVIVRE
jgi:hypothetical protein